MQKSPPALTIRQPWAHYIIHGGKDIENRNKPWKHRGPLLIHAGANTAGILKADRALYQFGAIIGVVDMVDCVTSSNSRWWINGPYGYVLENPRPLSAVPYVGQQGVFYPEGDEIAALLIELEGQANG